MEEEYDQPEPTNNVKYSVCRKCKLSLQNQSLVTRILIQKMSSNICTYLTQNSTNKINNYKISIYSLLNPSILQHPKTPLILTLTLKIKILIGFVTNTSMKRVNSSGKSWLIFIYWTISCLKSERNIDLPTVKILNFKTSNNCAAICLSCFGTLFANYKKRCASMPKN